jgi:hypothetical protein
VPVSDVSHTTAVLSAVARLQPAGVLDIGIGCGGYGAFCRQILDGTYGRVKPEDWQTPIVGVEAFEPYRNPIWGAYTKIVIADVVDYYEHIIGWPLVLYLDALEHVEATTGAAILRYLVEHNENVIVSVPLGDCPQGEVFNNPYEAHRTTFDGSEFRQYKYTVLFKGVCLVLAINGVRERINGVRE